MTYGIKILNNTADVIISETYENYQVIGSGIYANEATPPTVPAGAILMIAPSAVGYKMFMRVFSSIILDNYFSVVMRPASQTGYIDYRILANAPAPSGVTHGAKVYTPSSQIAYDSGRNCASPIATVRRLSKASGGALGESVIPSPFIPKAGKKRFLNYTALRQNARYAIDYKAYYECSYALWDNSNILTGEEAVHVGNLSWYSYPYHAHGTTQVFNFMDLR